MTAPLRRRTALTALGLTTAGAAAAPLLAAPAHADAPPTRMLAQQVRVERSGGVVATQGEREVVWEQVPTTDAAPDATLEIDTASRRHTLDGFGPALTHSAAWLLLRMPAARRRRLLQEMFSPNGPLRLSVLRIPVGTCDFAPDEGERTYYTLADEPGPSADPLAHFDLSRDEGTILPVLREILEVAEELEVVLSPWSAPAWMKTSGSLIGGTLHDDEETRRLWAEYLARAVEAYEAAAPGLHVSALTVQNEPLHDTAAYPCMGMSHEVQASVIAHLLEELDERGLDTRILSYDHNWDRVDYPRQVLDELAGQGVDPQRVGSAFHAYAGSADAVEPLHAAHPGSPIWFTEQSGTQDPGKPYEADFADGIWWMSNQLFLPALRHHHQGVILFNLVLDQDGGPGPATFTNGTGLFQIDESTGALTPNSELYVMAHFSRFVPAGSPVLTSPDAADLPNVACLRPDGSVVVVLHNNAPARTIRVRAGYRELTVALPGWTLATCVLTERQQVRRR